MRRAALITLVGLVILTSCTEEVEVGTEAFFDTSLEVPRSGLSPLVIRFKDAPGLDNRHSYEITEPPIETPHVSMGDVVWKQGPAAQIEGTRFSNVSRNEPAPYTRGTPMRVVTNAGWRGLLEEAPERLQVSVRGMLRSTTDARFEAVEVLLGQVEVGAAWTRELSDGEAEVVFDDAAFDTSVLPLRVDLFELEVVWELKAIGAGGVVGEVSRFETVHQIPTSFRKPRDHVRYKQVVTWASSWAAGDWVDRGEGDPQTAESVHQMALAMLYGVASLEDDGFRYGRVSRPDDDVFQSWADTLLDKKQAACGEFRGLMIALVEYHGIDARRAWFRFPESSADRYSFYITRDIAAVGTESRHWSDTNHSVVEVGGRIYDPTYTVYAPSWAHFEDWMFIKYCKGYDDRPCNARDDWCHRRPDDEETRCIDNPPGFDESWDLELIRDDPGR